MASYRIVEGTLGTLTNDIGNVVKTTCQVVFTNDNGENSEQQYYEVDGSDSSVLDVELQAAAVTFNSQPTIVEAETVVSACETALSERIVSEATLASEASEVLEA